MKMIIISRDFSDSPGGRTTADGPYSGQAFRDNLLVPALNGNEKVKVDLSDVLGFGSSFLEEAFGGLVRKGFSAASLKEKLIIVGGLKVYSSRIWRYIEDEDKRRK